MWSTMRFTPDVAVAARTAVRCWCSNSISPESVVEPSLVDTTTVQGGRTPPRASCRTTFWLMH